MMFAKKIGKEVQQFLKIIRLTGWLKNLFELLQEAHIEHPVILGMA